MLIPLVLLSSIPIGFLIAWLARDELIDGFRYLRTLFFFASCGTIASSFFNEVVTLTFGFITITSYISILKRFDTRWAIQRKR